MGAAMAWLTTVVVLLSGVVVLSYIGLNLAPAVGSWFHGIVHLLGTSL
ncbi:MAG: hypothetical protein L3K09_06725 [Thermoplasmata archaeon]|nr:hypothetical protein [Thermoplasmata archaeon]